MTRILFFITALFIGNTAFAGCNYADLTGFWNLYTTLPDGWEHCPIRIAGSGAITTNGQCTGDLNYFYTITGTATTNGNCEVQMQTTGGGDTYQSVFAQMNQNRDTVFGVGTNITKGIPHSFTMTKR